MTRPAPPPDPSVTSGPAPPAFPGLDVRSRRGERIAERRLTLAELVEVLHEWLDDLDPDDDPLMYRVVLATVELVELELARPAVAR